MERPPTAKRALDLALGTLLLALAAPVLAAAALTLAVRGRGDASRSDERPRTVLDRVLVRQEVTGLYGHPFTLRSLRTRRFRLDLLSRLPHVVRGRMSLVGPAPLPVRHPRARAAWRQTVLPGLTGPAQVGRVSPLPWHEPQLLDLHYVQHYCLATDLGLLARSLPALLPPPAPRDPRHGTGTRPAGARRRPVPAPRTRGPVQSPATTSRIPVRQAGRNASRPATQITAERVTLRPEKWVRSVRTD